MEYLIIYIYKRLNICLKNLLKGMKNSYILIYFPFIHHINLVILQYLFFKKIKFSILMDYFLLLLYLYENIYNILCVNFDEISREQ